MPRLGHFINNKPYSSDRQYVVRSPTDQEPLYEVDAADEDVIEKAIAAAHAALPRWRATTLDIRQKIFKKAADLLEEHVDAFQDAMLQDT